MKITTCIFLPVDIIHVYKNNNVIFLQTEEAVMIRMIVLDKKVFMFMYLKIPIISVINVHR